VSNTSPQQITGHNGSIFSQLQHHDVEEFYTGYEYWNLQQQIEILQSRFDDLKKQFIENTERMQEVQPTAIELATLVRLQSNGVSDVDLLDRMLERGEAWLDRTMQRLDYFEQLDNFISDDYTQWCQHALEGAYDWIDPALDGNVTSPPSTATTSTTTEDMKGEELVEATEELFLQKLSNDGDESLMQEITMKRPSITFANLEEAVPSSEIARTDVEDTSTSEITTPDIEEAHAVDTSSIPDLPTEEVPTLEHQAVEVVPNSEEEIIPHDVNDDTKSSTIEAAAQTEHTASEEPLSAESSSTATNEHPHKQEPVELSPVAKKSPPALPKASRVRVSSKRPNFIWRFFGKFWGR